MCGLQLHASGLDVSKPVLEPDLTSLSPASDVHAAIDPGGVLRPPREVCVRLEICWPVSRPALRVAVPTYQDARPCKPRK